MLNVEGEAIAVDYPRRVVGLAKGVVDVGGDQREALGVVSVGPIRKWKEHVDDQDEADHYVDDGGSGGGQRAAEEAGDGGPVEAEGSDAEPVESGSNLLRGDGVLVYEAEDRDAGDGRKEEAWDGVVSEASDEDCYEELKPCQASFFLFSLRCSALAK